MGMSLLLDSSQGRSYSSRISSYELSSIYIIQFKLLLWEFSNFESSTTISTILIGLPIEFLKELLDGNVWYL